MRDLGIAAILAWVSLQSLTKPWIGAVAWALVSLMSPHVQFGYSAANWPVATGIAACTLIGIFVTRERWNPLWGGPPKWLLAFMVWMCITLPFSFYFKDSLPLWERAMKIDLMILVTLALINTREKLQWFIWANVVAIGYYGVKGGAFTLATGGNYRVWGPGGFIQDNNAMALAMIVVIPLIRYLQMQMENRWARMAMTGALLLSIIMAVGSYSRGALLGLLTMGSIFWWKGSNKALWAALFVALGVFGASMMPDKYWERMDTIKSYDSDASAMGRINAWWMAFNLAKANLFGGGFSIYELPVFHVYAPVPDDVHAAHSIYFQVLGEHGFVGLFLFLMIGVSTWICARRLVKLAGKDPRLKWAGDLGAMVQVSMVGYGIPGAFLSLTYFDLPYNVMVMAVVGLRLALAQAQAQAAEPAPAALAGQPAAPPAGAQPALRPPRPAVRPGGSSPR